MNIYAAATCLCDSVEQVHFAKIRRKIKFSVCKSSDSPLDTCALPIRTYKKPVN